MKETDTIYITNDDLNVFYQKTVSLADELGSMKDKETEDSGFVKIDNFY